MSEIQKTNVAGFVKDKKTGLIIADDESRYRMLLANRKKSKETKTLMGDVDLLRSQVAELLHDMVSIKKALKLD